MGSKLVPLTYLVAVPSVTSKATTIGFSDSAARVIVTSWFAPSPPLASDEILIVGAASSSVMVYSQLNGYVPSS